MRLSLLIATVLSLAASPPTLALTLAVPPGLERDGLLASAYEDLARVIGRAVGEPVTIARPPNTFSYQDGLLRDDYDFVFDGPHVVGWRLLTAEHTPIFQLTAERVYVVLSRATELEQQHIGYAAGRRTCSPLPPRLAGVLLLSRFPNPLRQPALVDTHSNTATYQQLVSGRCEIGIMPLSAYEQNETRRPSGLTIIHEFPAMPGLGMTASRRVRSVAVEKLLIALFSDEGRLAMAPFLKAFEASGIETAGRERFVPYATLLKDEPRLWGALELASSQQQEDPSSTGRAKASARSGRGDLALHGLSP